MNRLILLSVEKNMFERGHDNSYRAAFLSANAELNEIFREVDRLVIRKELVEKVMEALQPLLGSPVQSFGRELPPEPRSPEPEQRAAEYVSASAQTTEAAPVAPRFEAPAPGDSIQRRIDSILGLAVA
jgi:hypothetical protein